MRNITVWTYPLVLLGLALSSKPGICDQPEAPAEQTRASSRWRGAPFSGVYKLEVKPTWFHNNTRFWYRNDMAGGAKEFIVVDAVSGSRQPAFDHGRLAEALSKAAGQQFSSNTLPFGEIVFTGDSRGVVVEAAGKKWKCDLASYECVAATDADTAAPKRDEGGSERKADRRFRETSPDGKWKAYVKERNVFLKSTGDDRETQLTRDGSETNEYRQVEWAPDSGALIAWAVEPGEQKEVYLVQSSPPGGGRAVLHRRPYGLPGDRFPKYQLSLFDPGSGKQIKPALDRYEHEWEEPSVNWTRDGSKLSWKQVDRGHQRLRVVAVDARSGAVRNLVDEKTDTFIWTAHTENVQLEFVNWLKKTDEIIYVSEKDGWRHLYLVDPVEGKIKHQITRGEWVVRGIDFIDEDKRQIWFKAGGRNAGQDPYFIHYYRVNFDGTGLVALTEANGTHRIQYSPDRQYLVATWSRVDAAPVHELRRTSDGGLVCQFEAADISELKADGWRPPEVFVAKGRDGKTDIWGIICRPREVDPSRKYPVLEAIYAGPQDSYVPKSFGVRGRFESLTKLGFIVVQIDGMGTANRSKAFHDVCWKNLKDAGFPDRILWHKAAAAAYPEYDIERVGLYGTSAGGQNAAGGVLFYPEFYKAAVANCGCHDNRMDKASWNEQWMGYPVGPHYAESSNIENAGKLQGHLMLVLGEMDDNVPTESTYRFVDALIRANKDFDFLLIPNGGHGAGGSYGERRLQDFFLRHLAGATVPNRNAPSPE